MLILYLYILYFYIFQIFDISLVVELLIYSKKKYFLI